MLEMRCPACGGTMQVEEGRLLRACPYCGKELIQEKAKPVWQVPGPGELEKKLEKISDPKKKYKLIQEALAKDPDDFFANRALLYHGRLHEGIFQRGGKLDYSILKCYLFNIFEKPESYSDEELDAKYEELLRGAQLKKVLSLCEAPDVFMREYFRFLSLQYVDLFIRGETKNSTYAFGFRRPMESVAKMCAVPVSRMLDTIRTTPHLDRNEAEREMLLSGVRGAFEALFPGRSSLLDAE